MVIELLDPPKDIEFMGSSRDDLQTFPEEARREAGYALWIAQNGGKAPGVKPLKGTGIFKGAAVLEIVEGHDTNTYRVVYTTKIGDVIYVLHAFMKKSTKGNETPKKEISLVERRYAQALEHHEKHYAMKGAG